MDKIFSSDVLNRSNDYSNFNVCIQNDVCSVRGKSKTSKWIFGQNSDLHETYKYLLNIKDIEKQLKDLDVTQLSYASRYVFNVYKKIDKSKKPSGLSALLIKVHNFIAPCFGMKKIEIYDYDRKQDILNMGNRIDALVRAKKGALSAKKDEPARPMKAVKPAESLKSFKPAAVLKKPEPKKSPEKKLKKSLKKDTPALPMNKVEPARQLKIGKTLQPLKIRNPTLIKAALPENFGADAFTLNVPGKVPEFEISDAEIHNLCSKSDFSVLNRDRKTAVGQLIEQTVKNGFPLIHDYDEKERSKFRIRYILFTILKGSLKPEARQAIQKRLIDAFKDCQTGQYEVVSDIYYDLCQSGTLASSFKMRWEKYKLMLLDAWIVERHPDTKHNPGNPSEQFPHVKSAYIELLSEELGLPGLEFATGDMNRPSRSAITMGDNKRSLIDQYKNRIKPKEFILMLCGIINDPKDTLIAKDLVHNWGKMQGDKWFGYYQKEKNYSGIDKPCEEQEDQEIAYISPMEVANVLIEAKILR